MKRMRFQRILCAFLLIALMLSPAAMASGEPEASSPEPGGAASAESSEERTERAEAEAQSLGLAGVKNARQLGGYTTGDGRTVKENVFIRSGSLHNATAEDLAILTDEYNVKLVVDFRSASDFEKTPDPAFNDAVIVNIPVWDESLNALPQADFMALVASFSGEPGMADLELYRRGYMGADEDIYIKQTFLNDFSLEGYREFIDLLLAQEEGTGILFHCSSGKDRTGSAAVILLTLLGVDRETVLRDFAMTNLILQDSLDEKVAASAKYTDDPEELYAVRTMNGVNPEFMARVFDYAEEQSGSMLAYIQQQFGVTDQEIQILRDKYLEGGTENKTEMP